MSKVLITGCAGSLGFNLAKKLIKNDFYVIGIDNMNTAYPKRIKEERIKELTKFSHFKFFVTDIVKSDYPTEIKSMKPKYFVHFAAKDFFYELSEDIRYLDYIYGNVVSTVKAFEFASEINVKKFIYSSTSSLYGTTKKEIFTEKDIIPKPISPQGASKLAAENIVEFMSGLKYIPAVNLRISTVYGPNMRPYKLIPDVIYRIKNNLPIKLYSELNSKRDYIFNEDFSNFVMAIFDKRITYQELNIGSGVSHSIKDIIKLIASIMGKDISSLTIPEHERQYNKLVVKDIYLDVSKACKILKYKQTVPLKKGLEKTVEWYLNHEDILNLSVKLDN